MPVRKEMANVSSGVGSCVCITSMQRGRLKHALEALRLQFQLATLQHNLVHQLTWGRFVNTQGGKGRNLPCDLYNEHVNRLYKQLIANMGANFTESASTHAARAVSSLERLALGFERQTGIHPEATAHSRKSDAKDVHIVVEVVLKARILEVIHKRCHSKFPDFSPNPLDRIDRDKMMKWIEKKQNSKALCNHTLQIVTLRMRKIVKETLM